MKVAIGWKLVKEKKEIQHASQVEDDHPGLVRKKNRTSWNRKDGGEDREKKTGTKNTRRNMWKTWTGLRGCSLGGGRNELSSSKKTGKATNPPREKPQLWKEQKKG